jgi:hypothetical protein
MPKYELMCESCVTARGVSMIDISITASLTQVSSYFSSK